MSEFEYFDFGLQGVSAKIGFSLIPKDIVINQNKKFYLSSGYTAKLKISGGYELSVEEAKILRDLLTTFIERSDNA